MARTKKYAALDLGAESGRAVIGSFDGRKLTLDVAHRFPNDPVNLPDGLHWDALRQFSEIKAGIARAIEQCGPDLASLGIDTWGVDFGLLDKKGALLGNPHHYRDGRTDGMVEKACRKVSRKQIFGVTGIQFMQLNTVFQLFAMAAGKSPQLDVARRLLFMPDLFNYWLTGVEANEYTIASTSQLLNAKTKAWAKPLASKLGIPPRIFAQIVPPGTTLGTMLKPVAEEVGGPKVKVVTPGTHDTASAVAAVPAETDSYVYLSSGTWSLIGVETPKPVINATSLKFNMTNEGGVCNTIRLLKNITGLWLVQECRRAWAAEGEQLSYSDLTRMAQKAEPFYAVISPDEPAFLKPGDMPDKIVAYCRKTKQKVPTTKGQIVRLALESLALKYRWTFKKLEELVGRRMDVLHIVGGGTQNKLLNQMAADSVRRPVVTGPIEATAAGNVLMQMLAMKDIKSLAEGRAIIRRSFQTDTYEPHHTDPWDEAYEKFCNLS
jgi:sugar (pentulose or hexulose) kinase